MDESYKQHIKQKAFEASIPQKSPGLSAFLGFFFPIIGALYTGRYILAMAFTVLEIVFLIMWFFGIGLILTFLFHFVAAIVCYDGAQRQNAVNYSKAAQALETPAQGASSTLPQIHPLIKTCPKCGTESKSSFCPKCHALIMS